MCRNSPSFNLGRCIKTSIVYIIFVFQWLTFSSLSVLMADFSSSPFPVSFLGELYKSFLFKNMSQVPFLLPITPQSASLLWNKSQPLILTFSRAKSCSSIMLAENSYLLPTALLPLLLSPLLPLSCLSLWAVREPLAWFGSPCRSPCPSWSLADSSAFLSKCFFPGP